MSIDKLMEYAEKLASTGYQQKTTQLQQRVASVFSVIYTQLVEYDGETKQPKAVCDYRNLIIRSLADEEKTFNRGE